VKSLYYPHLLYIKALTREVFQSLTHSLSVTAKSPFKRKHEGRRKEPQGERKAVAGGSEGPEVGDGDERIAEERRPRREVHVDRQRLRTC